MKFAVTPVFELVACSYVATEQGDVRRVSVVANERVYVFARLHQMI